MTPKIDSKASLKKLEALIGKMDKKLKELKEMRSLKEMSGGTKGKLEQGIKELERNRKEVYIAIKKLTSFLKRK